MDTDIKKYKIPFVPTDALYPSEDGKPMAASDRHRNQLFWTLAALKAYFSHDPSIYISGDILMYYLQGVPSKSISPDVLVTFDIGMKPRRTYLVWEEGKVPDFVMEFSSESTYRNDLTDKMDIYASLGIKNYFLYDAENAYLSSQLMGYELVDGNYVAISPDENGGIHASSLGLDFRIRNKEIAIFDPVANDWVRTREEAEAIRAEAEAIRADTAETRAAQEATRAETAEAENAQLREQLARLQART